MTESTLLSEITLRPGQFYFGRGRVRVQTLLGSCVAITLWHPRIRVGGMCHYLLPTRGENRRLPHGHYADDAVSLFLAEIAKQRTQPPEYEAKLFGGSDMFAALGRPHKPLNVSESNIDVGTRLLREHGFHIKVADLGGTQHRKICLELWSGDVWVQRGMAERRRP